MNLTEMNEEKLLYLIKEGLLSIEDLMQEIPNDSSINLKNDKKDISNDSSFSIKDSQEEEDLSFYSEYELNLMKYTKNEKIARKEIERISQGDVFIVHFLSSVGSVISGYRPAIVVGNNTSNNYSPVIQVVPITTKPVRQPTHVSLVPSDFCNTSMELYGASLGEQRCSISVSQLIKKIGQLKSRSKTKVLAADVCSIRPGSLSKEHFLRELIDNSTFDINTLKTIVTEYDRIVR